MNKSKCINICEYVPCKEEATTNESFNGIIYRVCKKHKIILSKQKKADNNSR